MIRRILSVITLGLFSAASAQEQRAEKVDQDRNPDLREFAWGDAAKQTTSLSGAKVIVHSVTEKAAFHRATPHDGHKLVVVDVTFKDYERGFGLSGVALIDGRVKVAQSFGSGAYKVFLNEDGTLMKDQSGLHLDGPVEAPYEKPIRVFLVYSIPKEVDKIGLGYWGKIIVDRPYEVRPDPDAKSAPTGAAKPEKQGR